MKKIISIFTLLICVVPLTASIAAAQYYYRGPYHRRYYSRGYSEKHITVRKQGEDPYAFRRDRQDVNMNLWNQARKAHPTSSSPKPRSHGLNTPNNNSQEHKEELRQREERLQQQKEKIRSQNSVYEKF